MEAFFLPAEWMEAGARWGIDGCLYLAEWRRGFHIHELRALFFEAQAARSLAVEVKNLTSSLEAAEQAAQEAEKRAAFYRAQLTRESRLGLALSRILG